MVRLCKGADWGFRTVGDAWDSEVLACMLSCRADPGRELPVPVKDPR